jgi:hypothetical protein
MSKFDYYYSDDEDSLDENNELNNIEEEEENERLLKNYNNFMGYLKENNYNILDKLSLNEYINSFE